MAGNLQQPYGELISGSPYAQYEYQTVTFPTGPDTDLIIRHSLAIVNPDIVDYMVVQADQAGSVYHDQSPSRKAWGKGYIVLRSNVASLKVKLLLTVARNS